MTGFMDVETLGGAPSYYQEPTSRACQLETGECNPPRPVSSDLLLQKQVLLPEVPTTLEIIKQAGVHMSRTQGCGRHFMVKS